MPIEIEDKVEENEAVAMFAALVEAEWSRGATPICVAKQVIASGAFPRFVARLRAEATTAFLVRGLSAGPDAVEELTTALVAELTTALVADQIKRIHARLLTRSSPRCAWRSTVDAIDRRMNESMGPKSMDASSLIICPVCGKAPCACGR